MRAFLGYVAIFFCIAAAVSDKAAGQVRVFAQVDTRREIYVGENFTYNIIIDGENKPGEVDVTPLARYNPRSAGENERSRCSWIVRYTRGNNEPWESVFSKEGH